MVPCLPIPGRGAIHSFTAIIHSFSNIHCASTVHAKNSYRLDNQRKILLHMSQTNKQILKTIKIHGVCWQHKVGGTDSTFAPSFFTWLSLR